MPEKRQGRLVAAAGGRRSSRAAAAAVERARATSGAIRDRTRCTVRASSSLSPRASPLFVGARQRFVRRGRRLAGRVLRHEHGLDRARWRSSRSSARARRSRSKVDDGSISVSAVGAIGRRRSVRPSRSACASDHHGSGRVERAQRHRSTTCSSTSAPSPWPRSRRPASSRAGFGGDLGRMVYVVAGIGARRQSLRGQHGPAAAWPSAIEGHERWWARLPGALRVARDALPRLRLHRRRDLGRLRRRPASGLSRSSRCRCS